MIIPYPHGLAFEDWSAYLVEAFASEGMPEWYPVEEEWKEWGMKIQEVDALEDVPNPTQFADWREWGDRVVEALY